MAAVNEQDLFKEEFKRYKKSSGSDFRDAINVRTPEKFSNELIEFSATEDSAHSRFCLRPTQDWKLYHLQSVPGLIVIPNPFVPGGQLHWVGQCLIEYPCKPNICNLDAHVERHGEGRLWPMSRSPLMPSVATVSASLQDIQPEGDERTDTELEEVRDRKRIKLSMQDSVGKGSNIYKLRWVTLGYHYDWNTKEYYRERRSPFPKQLGEMATFILKASGLSKFCAEAGIVNYYHLDSTLSGHTDHSEKDLSQPLLSISFGLSAIFLIGGLTKQVRPKALLLNSGDVVIMSGQSRLAYHGVPKILPPQWHGTGDRDSKSASIPECLSRPVCETYLDSMSSCGLQETASQSNEGESETQAASSSLTKKAGCSTCEEILKTWQSFESYMLTSRINVNIRQVTSDNFTF